MSQLLVIEGIDGSGKGTQTELLRQRLESAGQSVATLSFPQYANTFFGARIGDFLNGRFGDLNQVPPFLAAVLYAGDRFESRGLIEQALRTHDVVLLDRYVTSNMAHQAGKLSGPARDELLRWIDELEYGVYGLPRPDRVLLLDLPVPVAQQLISKKAQRTYTEAAADLQEADAAYLERVRQAYLQLAADQHWNVIPVCESGVPRELSAITEDLWAATGVETAGQRKSSL